MTGLPGRERELAALEELVTAPDGGALLLRGDPGIGKTAVLEAATARAAETGRRVLRIRGVQSEASLPFAGLHQLLWPLLDGLEMVAAGRREAVRAAFGMVESHEPPDLGLIAFGSLELLSAAADATPLAIAADDVQWLDRATVEVLLFLARRVEHERIAVLMAVRDEHLADAAVPELRLGGLDERAARSLLQARALPPDARRRLLEQAQGNPLALLELPGEEDARGLPPGIVPLTARLECTFAEQAAVLPEPARRLLLVAAAADREDVGEVLRAGSLLGLAEEALAPALDARLLALSGGRVRFRHPLVRSAVYQTARPAERRAVHAALAEVLEDEPDRAVWHRAAALSHPDDAVAAALEAAAARARRRGAIGVASSALERAVAVSADRSRRGRRLMDAAQLAFESSDSERAVWALNEAHAGSERVIATAERRWDDDAELAMSMLRLTNIRCWYLGLDGRVRRRLLEAIDRLGVGADDPQRIVVEATCEPERLGPDPSARLARLVDESGGDDEALRLLGIAAWTAGHSTLALDTLMLAIPALRARQRIGIAANMLILRADVAFGLGAWELAERDADEGLYLAWATSQPAWAAAARAVQSGLAGARGEYARAEALAWEAERAVRPTRVQSVLAEIQHARGLTALAAGEPADAAAQLSRIFDDRDPAGHYRVREWVLGDLVEALVLSGERQRAATLLDGAAPPSCERARIAHAHAQVALGRAADETGLARWPFARARLALLRGEPAEAVFDELRAAPWAARAAGIAPAHVREGGSSRSLRVPIRRSRPGTDR